MSSGCSLGAVGRLVFRIQSTSQAGRTQQAPTNASPCLLLPRKRQSTGSVDPRLERSNRHALPFWVGMQASAGASVCLVGTAKEQPPPYSRFLATVLASVIDRKQNNDLGCISLVQQSLEYRPWLRGWRLQSPPTATADSRQVWAALSQPDSPPQQYLWLQHGLLQRNPARAVAAGLGLEPSAE